VVDDMNDRVGFLGWPEVKTPNMKRLLSHGMLFTRMYVQYAICNPSRTSFLWGWCPDHTTVFNNDTRPSNVISPDVKYLPTYFKQFGYNMERYGKIMHSSFEIIRHFDIDVHILILTVFDTNEKIFEALCAGASGYLLKKATPSKIIGAIHDVSSGGSPMTPEIEKKVLAHFSKQPLKTESIYNLTKREKDILFYLTK